MEKGQKKKNNKWLVVVLCALGVIILVLVVGIAVIMSNNENGKEGFYDGRIKEISDRWQEAIDLAQTDNEKLEAYLGASFEIRDIIADEDEDKIWAYCDLLLRYIEKADELADNDDDKAFVDALGSGCVVEEDVVYSQSSTGGNE